MKRHLFNLAAAVSLLLCTFCILLASAAPLDVGLSDPSTAPPFNAPPVVSYGGFLVTSGHVHSSNGIVALTGRAFLVMALPFTVFPILWCKVAWTESIRAQRRDMGRCAHCGYDLRATPDRCPECGTPIPTEPAWRASIKSRAGSP
jgi:hypothetical protein